MPNIKINKKEFEEILGEKITDEKLKEEASYLGAHWNPVEGKKWEVEVYPNRPDLLSVEGLARVYKGFFEYETGLKKYDVAKSKTKLNVDNSVKDVRPYIGGAIVRDIELTQKTINGLIQLQEKLHMSVGRRRDKIAIGLHDLSQVKPPFTYKAVEPQQVSFKPLEYNDEIHLEEILDEHEKGKEYAWILEDEDEYPVIVDDNGKVLSFPPIINNQLTEVDTQTTDIFIDVTGKDKQTVQKVLNILSTALGERGGQIEAVKVNGEKMPDLKSETMNLDVEYFREVSGIDLDKQEIKKRLEMMRLGAKKKKDKLEVKIPAYRNDIMHQYDLIEEVVIAHRYTNIQPELPEIDQQGQEKEITEFAELLSQILKGTNSLETHTFTLSNKEKLYDKMEKERDGDVAEMENSLTEDYTVLRNWLLPDMMETLQRNKHHSYPQQFYEIEDVVELQKEEVKNKKKLVFVASGQDKDYTNAREILQVIERDIGVKFELDKNNMPFAKPGRSATIKAQNKEIGFIAELSESTLENWEIEKATSALEIDVEKLFGVVKK